MTPSSVRACIQAAAMQSRVVECFYSEPDPEIVDLVHAAQLAGWQVGSRRKQLRPRWLAATTSPPKESMRRAATFVAISACWPS